MNRMIMVLVIAMFCLSGISYASGTTPAAMESNEQPKNPVAISLYDQGVAASKAKDYQKALPLFEQALQQDPNNPDILNELAHAQRKTGSIDEAIVNYQKALTLRPKFPEAREYLGEAYIDAALREAETLKGYGSAAQEELEDLTNDIKEASQKV
jgi:cytochrome c-type biogenesis protein CcmH/NrfG